MAQSLDRLKESPSQTAGPYVHIGLTPNFVGIGGVYGQDLGSTMVNDQRDPLAAGPVVHHCRAEVLAVHAADAGEVRR